MTEATPTLGVLMTDKDDEPQDIVCTGGIRLQKIGANDTPKDKDELWHRTLSFMTPLLLRR